jgi:hypothetical protein
MATTISRTAGNLLRSDIDGRDEIRAAAHVLAALLARGGGGGTYVLDFEKDDEAGSLSDLGVYDYEDFTELQDDDEEPYEDDAESD